MQAPWQATRPAWPPSVASAEAHPARMSAPGTPPLPARRTKPWLTVTLLCPCLVEMRMASWRVTIAQATSFRHESSIKQALFRSPTNLRTLATLHGFPFFSLADPPLHANQSTRGSEVVFERCFTCCARMRAPGSHSQGTESTPFLPRRTWAVYSLRCVSLLRTEYAASKIS